jgi:hypothetical protein
MQIIIHFILITILITNQTDGYKNDTIMSEQKLNLPERTGETPQIGQTPPQLQFSDKSPRVVYQNSTIGCSVLSLKLEKSQHEFLYQHQLQCG